MNDKNNISLKRRRSSGECCSVDDGGHNKEGSETISRNKASRSAPSTANGASLEAGKSNEEFFKSLFLKELGTSFFGSHPAHQDSTWREMRMCMSDTTSGTPNVLLHASEQFVRVTFKDDDNAMHDLDIRSFALLYSIDRLMKKLPLTDGMRKALKMPPEKNDAHGELDVCFRQRTQRENAEAGCSREMEAKMPQALSSRTIAHQSHAEGRQRVAPPCKRDERSSEDFSTRTGAASSQQWRQASTLQQREEMERTIVTLSWLATANPCCSVDQREKQEGQAVASFIARGVGGVRHVDDLFDEATKKEVRAALKTFMENELELSVLRTEHRRNKHVLQALRRFACARNQHVDAENTNVFRWFDALDANDASQLRAMLTMLSMPSDSEQECDGNESFLKDNMDRVSEMLLWREATCRNPA